MYIYGLVCPVQNKVMYVGKSVNANTRLRQHISEARRICLTRKDEWLRELCELNLEPSMMILEECTDEESNQREHYWISHYRLENAELKNTARVSTKLKSERKSNSDMLHIRLSNRESEIVQNLVKNVYGFKNTSEFLRYVIDYMMEKRPVLGRKFTPAR